VEEVYSVSYMKTRPSSVQMHKQTTAVNPTGVNKIPHNFHTTRAATFVAVQLLKDSLRDHLNGRSAPKG